MACPECGGTDRVAIGANYFRCTTELRGMRRVQAPSLGPGSGTFPGPMMWVDRPVFYPCDHKYIEGDPPAGTPQCRHGFYALGVCSHRGCRIPLHEEAGCGSRVDGALVCETHRELLERPKKEAEAAQRKAAEDQARDRDQQARAERERRSAAEEAKPNLPSVVAVPFVLAHLTPIAAPFIQSRMTDPNAGRSILVWLISAAAGWALFTTARVASRWRPPRQSFAWVRSYLREPIGFGIYWILAFAASGFVIFNFF